MLIPIARLVAVLLLFLSSCASSPEPTKSPPTSAPETPEAVPGASWREGWYRRGDNTLVYVGAPERVYEFGATSVLKVHSPAPPGVKPALFDFVETRDPGGSHHRLISRETGVEAIAMDLGIRCARVLEIRSESPGRFLISVELVPSLNNESRSYPDKPVRVRQLFRLDADPTGARKHMLTVLGARKL